VARHATRQEASRPQIRLLIASGGDRCVDATISFAWTNFVKLQFMVRSRLGTLAVLLVSLSQGAYARSSRAGAKDSDVAARQVERRFESRYKHASTLKAIFYERYGSGRGTGEAESGTVYFSRPGRMRWDYESPQKKLFIVDGKNVWFYIPDDHTASRSTLKNSSDWRTPIALLAENANLGRVCRNVRLVETHESAGSHNGGKVESRRDDSQGSHDPSDGPAENQPGLNASGQDSVLKCAPRAKSDETGQPISDVLLTIDPDGYLVRVVIQQPGDVTTEFRFGNWQENIHIAETVFHFQPPPGVEIVDEDKLAGQMN
jgi:outer membrane lipoprotein-sorting protein